MGDDFWKIATKLSVITIACQFCKAAAVFRGSVEEVNWAQEKFLQAHKVCQQKSPHEVRYGHKFVPTGQQGMSDKFCYICNSPEEPPIERTNIKKCARKWGHEGACDGWPCDYRLSQRKSSKSSCENCGGFRIEGYLCLDCLDKAQNQSNTTSSSGFESGDESPEPCDCGIDQPESFFDSIRKWWSQ